MIVCGPVSIAAVIIVAHQAERTKAVTARVVSVSGVKVVGRPVRISGLVRFRARTVQRGVALRTQGQPGRKGIRQFGLRVGDLWA